MQYFWEKDWKLNKVIFNFRSTSSSKKKHEKIEMSAHSQNVYGNGGVEGVCVLHNNGHLVYRNDEHVLPLKKINKPNTNETVNRKTSFSSQYV